MKDRIKQYLASKGHEFTGTMRANGTYGNPDYFVDLVQQCFNELQPQWVRIGGLDSLPPYEEPVLIKIKGVVQSITYTLDSFEDSYWFEPYHFNEELKIKASGDIEWMPLPPSEVMTND